MSLFEKKEKKSNFSIIVHILKNYSILIYNLLMQVLNFLLVLQYMVLFISNNFYMTHILVLARSRNKICGCDNDFKFKYTFIQWYTCLPHPRLREQTEYDENGSQTLQSIDNPSPRPCYKQELNGNWKYK